jgi:hypothetical protein
MRDRRERRELEERCETYCEFLKVSNGDSSEFARCDLYDDRRSGRNCRFESVEPPAEAESAVSFRVMSVEPLPADRFSAFGFKFSRATECC